LTFLSFHHPVETLQLERQQLPGQARRLKRRLNRRDRDRSEFFPAPDQLRVVCLQLELVFFSLSHLLHAPPRLVVDRSALARGDPLGPVFVGHEALLAPPAARRLVLIRLWLTLVGEELLVLLIQDGPDR